MALHLHRAERTDLLADGLGQLLSSPLPDPFAEELVLVPARGVERWLSQRLAHVLGAGGGNDGGRGGGNDGGRGGGKDGVCAGVSFRSPRSLIAELAGTDDIDPWSPDSMVWPLLEVVDAAAGQPWCRPLAEHLGHGRSGEEAELRLGRRYAVARRLAGLFASYAAQRPQLLIDWCNGADTDGLGAPLDPDLGWQPELWRQLVRRVPADPPHVRHDRAVAALRAEPTELPPRISLFGQTRLAATDIELLTALSTHHDVHLWIPHPSDALWRSLGEHRTGRVRRADAEGRDDVAESGHPLLLTLGRDVRELQQSLPETAVDHGAGAGEARPDTLLGWLQSDLSANAVRPQGRTFSAADRSVRVHACHGPARQIDVLRDVLLGALADDPTLEPRDILVMCPDIDTFAPLIVAGFGLGESDGHGDGHPAQRLRVRLADRSPVQTNPLLAVTANLLDLVGGRATASEVLNLAEAGPVRARFGFTDDDLDTINEWVREAGIRWGFDQEHREPFGVGAFVHNTWRFGVDRVLCGVAMSDDSQDWLGLTLPLDDVGSNRVELAGRFAEFIDRLQGTVDSLSGTRTLAEWLGLLTEGVARLTRVGAADGWQSGQLHSEFADMVADAGPQASIALRLSDIRSLLKRHLSGRPTRANFRSGGLTVCTMVPMRSVPHRVVCLVGLDDGVFPRVGAPDGDDVLARDPVVGERDIRSEDRQLLLDAISAAGEKLVITYTGADEYTGQARPPCVPLAEILDALDRTTPAPVRGHVLVDHPLQPFDSRNVTPGELGEPTAFTFDPTALVAAEAIGAPAEERSPGFLEAPLPAPEPGDVGLEDLLGFFNDPVKGFFRSFGVALPFEADAVEDAIPVEVDALAAWGVGNRMLDDLLRGRDPEWALHAEWRRGQLPPGQLGWRKAQRTQELAKRLAATTFEFRSGAAAAVDVDVDLGAGRRLTGTVNPVHADRYVSVTYSTLGPKHVLQSWIRLLALTAAAPERDWSAICIGRRGGNGVAVRAFGRPAQPAATLLAQLVAIYDTGRCEPVPLPLKTSHAWAAARRNRADPYRAALYAWKSNKYPGDDDAAAHRRAWGPDAPLEVLLGPPAPGEEFPGETTRLGALSRRVWGPMLDAEQQVDR
ncbi:exodeoxyribonuclease V subunit gamma [[Mycobacterium] wendilense]|uniref:RecBCD enzyme subunit RecC n=1 Tax=[Mycobacterium] wendilense TaxID=3064284 RepID=A0ABM9MJF4_9MYCO|nr:exodeoxyribonuclease V subunit gamma [Mycolicibacterium sp. MU0050]CAJ1586720.1 exodeoxyribonuclease V subunit gamma [Mycolicibacterium sp. MU0050]